jgi:hypothetical protein
MGIGNRINGYEDIINQREFTNMYTELSTIGLIHGALYFLCKARITRKGDAISIGN